MNTMIYTEWQLSETFTDKTQFPKTAMLARYYILYWDYEHFIKQIRFTELGCSVNHQGILYDARLLQGENWREFSKSKRVCLSFRAWKDSKTGELKGVVLVKKAC